MVEVEKPEIPNGAEHMAFIMRASMYTLGETAKHSDLKSQDQREMIGTCLNALYQAATCHRQCHGGAHLLERLCGRAYNLACGAYNLSVIGLYDEALNLIRGMGEITNLIILSTIDGNAIQQWIHADRKTRLNKFSPKRVREMVTKKGMELCATDEWYQEMCEAYTHITPDTRPNIHSGRSWIGGKFDKEGENKALGELFYVSVFLAMFVCKYFKFDDLFAEITDKLQKNPEKEE